MGLSRWIWPWRPRNRKISFRAEFTFEASIQKDPDVKIRDGIFLEDTGRFSIFLAGNGTGDGLFNGGKKLELGVLQTAPWRTSPSGGTDRRSGRRGAGL